MTTPQQAIRAKCLECVGDETIEVRNCTARPDKCKLWPFRSGKGREEGRGYPKASRLRAIRDECLLCMGGTRLFVEECESEKCALWPFRLGRNPKRAGLGPKLTPEKARELRNSRQESISEPRVGVECHPEEIASKKRVQRAVRRNKI